MEERLKVFRLGWQHNKWLVVMPGSTPDDIDRALPMIIEQLKQSPRKLVTTFDHVEFLGIAISPEAQPNTGSRES